jgi:hypothetical protein
MDGIQTDRQTAGQISAHHIGAPGRKAAQQPEVEAVAAAGARSAQLTKLQGKILVAHLSFAHLSGFEFLLQPSYCAPRVSPLSLLPAHAVLTRERRRRQGGGGPCRAASPRRRRLRSSRRRHLQRNKLTEETRA